MDVGQLVSLVAMRDWGDVNFEFLLMIVCSVGQHDPRSKRH